MKYIKFIFICLISLQYSALCAQESTSVEPITVSSDIQQTMPTTSSEDTKTEIPAETAVTTEEKNELQDWDNHLKTLNENWDTSTNAPEPTWTSKAIEIAVTAVTDNKSLAEQLKSSYLDALTKFTTDTAVLTTEFNNAIDKALASTETKEESKTETPAVPEQVPALEPQEEQQKTETTTTPVETPPTTTESEKTEPAKEEKKENLIAEWNTYLANMQHSRSNLEEVANKAAELAQKIQEQNLMHPTKLIEEFENAIEGAIARRPKEKFYLLSIKDDVMSNFASLLGVYRLVPSKPIDYYEPMQEMAPSPEEIATMQQKLAEQERIAALEAKRHKESMIKQAAINRATEKERLTQRQWQKAQESIREAEQRKIRQLQAEAEQLKRDLKKASDEQKAAREKSLFTRAREKVTQFIWGPQTTQLTEESITEKRKQLEQLTKQIEQEEAILFKETCQKNDQAKRAEEIRTLTGHTLTKIEVARKAELEAEERECARIADTDNLTIQQLEWLTFMDHIRNLENIIKRPVTPEDNQAMTKQAIQKAESIIRLASRVPSVNVTHIEQTLKNTFNPALVHQQHGKMRSDLKELIYDHIDNFNNEINNFVQQYKGQL